MNITLNGRPLKTVGKLEIGESGYVPTKVLGIAPVDNTNQAWPAMTPPLGDCYRITRTDDGLDMAFVPAVGGVARTDTRLLIDASPVEFSQRVWDTHANGWRVDIDSIIVTADNQGGFVYLALLHRAVRDE